MIITSAPLQTSMRIAHLIKFVCLSRKAGLERKIDLKKIEQGPFWLHWDICQRAKRGEREGGDARDVLRES